VNHLGLVSSEKCLALL